MRTLQLLKFLSWRYWRRHWGGFLLSALGVALGIAVFVAIQVANYSVLRAFDASLDAITGRANLQITGGEHGLPEAVYTKLVLRDDPRLEAASPLVARTLFSPTLKRSVLIQGIDPFAELAFRDLAPEESGAPDAQPHIAADARGFAGTSNEAVTKGVPGPSNEGLQTAPSRTSPYVRLLTEPRTIAVSQSLAQRAHLHLGSRLQFYSGARTLNFNVGVILTGATTGRAFGGDFAVLDIASAQEAFGMVGKLSGISLRAEESDLPALTAELKVLVPGDAEVARPASRGAEVAGLLRAFQINLSALSCIAVFVGAFLIYNAIAMAVVRRRHEVGILRATGTPEGTLTAMFLVEAGGIGLVGGALGLGLGLLMARFALKAVATTVSQLYIAVRASEIYVPAWLPLAAIVGGGILATLAALPAAHEGARVSPREAISKAAPHHASARGVPRLALVGVLLLVLGVVLCLPPIARVSIFAGFVASFCSLAGFALLCPTVAYVAGEAVQRVGARGGLGSSVELLLAGQYLRRAIGRSGLAVAALSVALAMSIGMALMVRSFRDTVAGWVNTTITADMYVTVAGGFASSAGPGLPPDVVQYVRTLPQVRLADTIRGTTVTLKGQQVRLAASEMPALATGDRPMQFLQTARGAQAARTDFVTGKALLVSERFKNLVGPGAGGTMTVDTPRGPRTYPIAGVFADYTPDQCMVYLPKALYVRDWGDRAVDGVGLYVRKGTNINTLRDSIERHFADRYTLTLVPNGELRQSVFETFDQTFQVTYALQFIAVLVAGIGVFDTLLALLLERGREIAALRAIGASRAQILRGTLWEFSLIGILAWGVGILSGGALAAQLIYVINRQFFGWSIAPSLPLAPLLSALALALGAALVAGGLPALRAASRPLADALQQE